MGGSLFNKWLQVNQRARTKKVSWSKPHVLEEKKKRTPLDMVADVCNVSYSGSRGRGSHFVSSLET